MNTPIRIVIIDDHPIVRQGIRSLLSNYQEFTLIGEADNGKDGFALVIAKKPDITLLDISMPNESGLECIKNVSDEMLV